ncbi:MAG: lysoplasmalogenase [Chloroflexi bacterium]|nr:lysoplasmalogenase [Chloroflexota bacterium]
MATTSRSRPLQFALLAIGLISALLFIAEVGKAFVVVRVILKSVPLLCLMVWVRLTARDRYANLILAGLIFSLAGDILLEISADLFVPGLIAFLIGHVWYIAAFLSVTRELKWPRVLPFAAWVVLAYLLLFPNLKGMALPVAAYVIVIGSMMWRASATIASPVLRWQGLALIGAILFGLSDTLLAFKKFSGVTIGPHFTVIGLYWLGQFGLALSVQRLK